MSITSYKELFHKKYEPRLNGRIIWDFFCESSPKKFKLSFTILSFLRSFHEKYGGHHYFLSWRESWTKFEDWDWFNARNYCRWGKQKTSFLKL